MLFHLFFSSRGDINLLVLLLSFLLSLLSCFFLIPNFILFSLKFQKNGQPIRVDGPKRHLVQKKNIPTMGGIIIVFSTLLSVFLFSNLKSLDIWLIVITFLAFAALGFIDDILKLKYYTTYGLKIKIKLILQFIIAFIVIIFAKYIYHDDFTKTHLFYGKLIDLGILYIPFFSIIIVSYANAVNLTDGLDGLVTLPIIVAILSLVTIIISHSTVSESINILLVCSALVGSLISFLWFNVIPAKLFMGDIGSLSLGGVLGILSILTKYELVFALICSLFIMETLSVIIQIFYFKVTKGKRVFLMAPIHHHFECIGWKEYTIVFRFWIFSILSSLFFLIIYFCTIK